MKYLKVFVDFVDSMELLGEAERGRLFTAMLKYAESGAEIELKGNEKFLWMAAKSEIDRQRESYEKRCETNRAIATNRYESSRMVTNRNESYQDKDKDKDTNNPPISPLKRGEWDEVSPELREALEAFADMRKKLRKPLTDRAKSMALSSLRKLSQDEAEQIAIVEQSIFNGWQGFYALKDELHSKQTAEAEPPTYKKLTLRR